MIRPSLNRRNLVTGGASIVAGSIVASRLTLAQTPDATGDASPAASSPALPEGPLGTAIAWLESAMNAPGGPTEDDVIAAFSPVYLQAVPPGDIVSLIAGFAETGGPWTIDTTSMITTMDYPPSNASFFIDEPGGLRLSGGISIDRASGLIGAFTLEPAAAPGTPEASPVT